MNVSEKHPFVSVVMPTYNVGKYIEEAVQSILNQTFLDFEFIIVDDGSTDHTPEILRSFSDPRIRLLFNEKNEGNYPARNRGCRLAKGKYIAVMDADDVAMPERLEKQVGFMETNPDILACGTAYRLLGQNKIIVQPIKWDEIRYVLLMTYCMLHPTMIIRSEIMTKINFYKEESICAEDYDLTLRLAINGRIVNLPDVLLNRRLRDDQISSIHMQKQNMYGSYIQIRYQHEMGIFYPPKDNDAFLVHLAAYIRSIVSYVEGNGLFYGKMGLILFFYCYSRYSQNHEYLKLADRMLSDMMKYLKSNMPIGISSGLCGLGLFLGYLISEKFIDNELDDLLENIDRMIVSKTEFETEDWSFETGIIGLVYYVSYRLSSGGKNIKYIFDTSYINQLSNRILILENHTKWNNPYLLLLNQCHMNLQEMVVRPMDWNEFFKMAISSLPTTLSFGKWNLGLNRGATGIGLNLIFKLNM
ncbi:glycosyltransferase [Parabacteroides faecis]|uniref:glycosyltransferase family 2 protein n=1 Tax=Parabacteroides faecis TaxID=1217282 RepID=UPI00216432B3|nr:glycosyltransferase [Parabacteroides faecis]MCS2889647.1 glycosyltransferase [Parabacteroides faecis]UVQ46643.1 glycosyltransferase [Parabacteroides faecis]